MMQSFFREVYDSYSNDVFRYAMWLCGETAVAEDITSETFARAWAGRSKIRTETVRAYLFTIARNIFLKQQAKNQRITDLTDTLASFQPNPEQSVTDQIALESIMRLLNEQPEIDRSAFLLRFVYEMSYAEIGRVLQISVSNAKVKIHRLRLKIAKAQTEELEGL